MTLGAVLFWLGQAGTTDLFKEDGVLVSSQGEARTVAAMWQLVVLITPPIRPPVETWIANIEATMDQLTLSKWGTDATHWKKKLELLSIRLRQEPVVAAPHEAHSRTRRSPFDFIGAGASWLFGVVTKDQLRAVQDTLNRNNLQTQALKHNQREMLSMMNKTREIQRKMAGHIRLVEGLMEEAAEEAGRVAKNLEDLALLGKIRIAVEEIESIVLAYENQKAQHHREEMQLERGRLTEDLITEARLITILERARVAGYESLPVHWYYKNAEVQPMWGKDSTIAFSVGLSMVGFDKYIVYSLDYLPIVMDNEHLRTLTGEPAVAVNTRTRASFNPKTCLGGRPMVCLPTIEHTLRTCEGALVTGDVPDRCDVRITKKGHMTATVLAPRKNSKHAVVAPHTDEMTIQVRCIGKPQVNLRLTQPTMVELPASCYIEGEGWLLKAMEVKHEEINIQRIHPVLDIPALNISWPAALLPKLKQHLEVLSELRVPALSFNNIVSVPEKFVQKTHFNIFWYCVVAVAGAVLIMGIVYLICRCKGYCKKCLVTKKIARRIDRTQEKSDTVVEINPDQVESANIIRVLSPEPPRYEPKTPTAPSGLGSSTVVRYTPHQSALELVRV